jgi:hypothetical protein
MGVYSTTIDLRGVGYNSFGRAEDAGRKKGQIRGAQTIPKALCCQPKLPVTIGSSPTAKAAVVDWPNPGPAARHRL